VVEDTSQARDVTAEFRKKLSGLRAIQEAAARTGKVADTERSAE
jgi:hypothetical protein